MSHPYSSKILVTGASGLLGRAVFHALKVHFGQSLDLYGWSHSRDGFTKVSFADPDAIRNALHKIEPNIIVHCASIRRPDAIKNDAKLAQIINVDSNKLLADYMSNVKDGFLVYISTDYVFDGENPPYAPEDCTQPLNEYAEQKVKAEQILMQEYPAISLILRVPILYGPVEYLGEGAVDEVLKILLISKEDPIHLDNFHQRYPTHVADVANAIILLISKRMQVGSDTVNGIYQWRSEECLTKYEMAQIMLEKLEIESKNLAAINERPTSGAKRPRDCQMNVDRMLELGGKIEIEFRQGIVDFCAFIE